ncbi:KH homology domain-containing protein 1-like isoform X2 [Panthera uncia]|uniref:KH homology domain-containing protein 1-like isoform X2 n=1 Tax=Panthera uncia TaxID=29064 RepID=UPI0020FFAC78|nr:KH homology domain-containing protein 1-like isoform X2 [Panthera uncia]
MLTVFQRCFDVLIVVKDILGCGVLIFIIGWPFYQYLAMLLSTTMASQLRIRRNRAKAARTKYQTEGLSTEIHFLTVLEARSPRSKGWFLVRPQLADGCLLIVSHMVFLLSVQRERARVSA